MMTLLGMFSFQPIGFFKELKGSNDRLTIKQIFKVAKRAVRCPFKLEAVAFGLRLFESIYKFGLTVQRRSPNEQKKTTRRGLMSVQ